MDMMNGLSLGILTSTLAAKFIASYRALTQFLFCLNGCGNIVLKTSTHFSFGYSFGI
jgi:hypothetical protein